jgi:hypothetical protein
MCDMVLIAARCLPQNIIAVKDRHSPEIAAPLTAQCPVFRSPNGGFGFWHGGKRRFAPRAASVFLQAESTAKPTGDAVHMHLIFEDRLRRTENIRHPIDQPVDTDVKSDVLAETVADHHLELARRFLFAWHSDCSLASTVAPYSLFQRPKSWHSQWPWRLR